MYPILDLFFEININVILFFSETKYIFAETIKQAEKGQSKNSAQ